MSSPRFTPLPTHILPSRYDLEITPRISSFNGHVIIQAMVIEPQTFNVTLHVGDLQIDYIKIFDADRKGIEINGTLVDSERTLMVISTVDELPVGRIMIEILYDGKISNSGTGLFRQDYNVSDQLLYLLATQLEAIFARQVLPCFDQPDMKAKFQVKIGRPLRMQSLSNMIRIAEGLPHPDTDFVWDVYETSVEMSTYLGPIL